MTMFDLIVDAIADRLDVSLIRTLEDVEVRGNEAILNEEAALLTEIMTVQARDHDHYQAGKDAPGDFIRLESRSSASLQ